MNRLEKELDGRLILECRKIVRNWTIASKEEAKEVIDFYCEIDQFNRTIEEIYNEKVQGIKSFTFVYNQSVKRGEENTGVKATIKMLQEETHVIEVAYAMLTADSKKVLH